MAATQEELFLDTPISSSSLADFTRGVDDENPRRGRPRLYQSNSQKNQAYRVRQRQRAIFPPLPPGPYRVIYADPPWQYSNDGLKAYGHAANHYATCGIEALCALPVKRVLEKHAVLFLWVTAPLWDVAQRVYTAWGFRYKANLVWDKGSTNKNYGYYVGVQHEHLLICTRGACRPEVRDLLDSVLRIAPRRHSQKPPEVRQMIDYLYPTGPRLELFARERVDGWDAWGREVPPERQETVRAERACTPSGTRLK